MPLMGKYFMSQSIKRCPFSDHNHVKMHDDMLKKKKKKNLDLEDLDKEELH